MIAGRQLLALGLRPKISQVAKSVHSQTQIISTPIDAMGSRPNGNGYLFE